MSLYVPALQKLKFFQQNRAQFSYKWNATMSRRVWTILPLYAAEFCKLVHGIWQNFPRKTVGPSSNCIMLDDMLCSKRKIEDFLNALDGFRMASNVVTKLQVSAEDFRFIIVLCLP